MPAISLLKKPDSPMAEGVERTPSVSKRRIARGHLPVKRSINFVTVGEKPIDWRVAIPSIALIILCAGLVSKVAVIDRFAALAAAQRRVHEIQRQIDEKTYELEHLEDISFDYAHYTISDMTDEEKGRVSRVIVMDVVQRVILPTAPLDTWNLSGNELTMKISSTPMKDLTAMAELLRAEPSVQDCVMMTYSTTVTETGNVATVETATADLTVTFKDAITLEEEKNQEAQAAAQTVTDNISGENVSGQEGATP